MDHTVVHFEIPAKDAQSLKNFYEKLFAWKIIHEPAEGMDYWDIQTVPIDEKGMLQRPGVNGSILQKQAGEERTAVNYITVENIDEYLTKVSELGGKVLTAKQQIPNIGYIAVAMDPEGNHFGLIQPEMT